jgi:hypothetical protein
LIQLAGKHFLDEGLVLGPCQRKRHDGNQSGSSVRDALHRTAEMLKGI